MDKEDIVKTIEVKPNSKWVGAILKGDFNCPDCGEVMVVIAQLIGYGFCLNCRKYWLGEVWDD